MRDFEQQRSPASSYELERRSCFVVFLTVKVLPRCQPLSSQLAILLSTISFVILDKVDYVQVWAHGLLLPRLDVSTPHSHTLIETNPVKEKTLTKFFNVR